MPVRQIYLKHKTQTKCNDCWYASIQMLKTWQADGVKTKPSGTHTKHLHAGIVGHRLRPDSKLSKHFKDVLKENGLITLGPLVVRLTFATDVLEALETYGPLMVGGDFGTFIGVATNMGHYVVVAGVDTDQKKYSVHDPWLDDGPRWMDIQAFCKKAWQHIPTQNDESVIAVQPPIAIS